MVGPDPIVISRYIIPFTTIVGDQLCFGMGAKDLGLSKNRSRIPSRCQVTHGTASSVGLDVLFAGDVF